MELALSCKSQTCSGKITRKTSKVFPKNSEMEKKFQKYRGRVVLRGDVIKDDSGSYTVLTDRGSSASLVTAARVLDVNSCEGAASDAESAYTHLKMEEAPDCQSQNVRLFDLETSTTFSMSKIMRQNRRSCGST